MTMFKKNILIFTLLFITISQLNFAQKKSNTLAGEEDVDGIVFFNDLSLNVLRAGHFQSGVLDSILFLHSGGFFLSGFNDKGELWANGVQRVFQVEDYVQGTIESGPGVLGTFVVTKDSEPFGIQWKYWNAAVDLGAEFYDGDNDGEYYPVDKNENGIWDPDEDKPAIYGEATSFSVYNDGIPSEERMGLDRCNPQGIEIRQTVWGYRDNPALRKVIFVKYNIRNSGTVSSNLRNVIFTFAVDPDLGWYADDYAAYDSTLEAGSAYYGFKDFFLNEDQIAFAVNLIQGPKVKSGNPNDIYYGLVGKDLEVVEETGGFNATFNAFNVIPNRNIISSAENFRLFATGDYTPDACNDPYGRVYDENCESINPRLMYTGNPTRLKGWINTRPRDQHLALSTQAFNLSAGESVDIVLALVVETGETGYKAYENLRRKNEFLKFYYFDPNIKNFPTINPIIIANENSIELVWETPAFMNYKTRGYRSELDFEGFNVYMYNSPVPVDELNGIMNSKLIASYDVANEINSILIEDPEDYSRTVLYESGIQLDQNIYSDPKTGRLRIEIDRDPFNFGPLVKGRPYFISIVPFSVNRRYLTELDRWGTYLLKADALIGHSFAEPKIITDNSGSPGIIVGESENDIYYDGEPLQHVKGNSEALLTYTVYDKNVVNDHLYEVSFERTSDQLYSLAYSVLDLTTSELIIDSANVEEADGDVRNLIVGVALNIDWVEPEIKNVSFIGDRPWYEPFDTVYTGVFYVGNDWKGRLRVRTVTTYYSLASSFGNNKIVELRFADTSKAYRYVRRAVRYTWDGAQNVDSGFVNIPVSAYAINNDGSETQLALGFIENAFPGDAGFPDGKWNPGTDIEETKEYLIVFDASYSDDPFTNIVYTGTETKVADIAHGYTPRSDDPEFNDSLRTIARSSWFNAMYVIGFETSYDLPELNPTGILRIEPSQVLTPSDKYIFRVRNERHLEEKIDQFEKVNVFPNPLFGYNSASGHFGNRPDEPFVTFTHLPIEATIKIYTLSGNLVKTIQKNDLSPMIRWDLKNEYGRRIGSGLYIALIENKELGKKILKFSVIMPQKQIQTD